MRNLMCSIIALLSLPAMLAAQPLADRVPDDAQIYIGWNGMDAPGAGFDQSHWKAVLDSSQLSQFFHDSVPRLFRQIDTQNPEAGRKARQFYNVLSAMVEHPTAIYFGGLSSVDAGGPPLPKMAIVCDGGEDAAKVERQIRGLLQNAPMPGLITIRRVDTLIVISDFVYPDQVEHPLAQNADFQSAMGTLGKDPSVAVYVNAPALVSTVDALINQLAPPQVQQMWPQARDALGIAGVKSFAATAGFDGKNWSGQAFMSAPSPRKGLLAMGDVQPLADDLLALIPDTATFAGAGSCDLSALFTQIDQAVTQFAPDQGNQFHQILGQINQTLGFDIQKDFLAALGAQWGYYEDPAVAGTGPMGMVFINRLRNADQFQNSLGQLENLLNGIINQQFAQSDMKLTVQIRQATVDGTTLHFAATPFITPAWAIKDGTLYIGFYPQVVDSAFSRPTGSKSIKDNPSFQGVMQALGAPSQYSSFGFIDLPKTMPDAYQSCLMISRLYLGMGDMANMQSPPLVLPTLSKLLAETEPAGSVSWSDDAGFHMKSIEPFPGAAGIGSMQGLASGMLGEEAMMMSVLLPSLNRARETANRVKCASNLRQIGQAILLYSNDNKGAYPPDLGTLIKTEDITAQVFCCPDTNTKPPSDLTPDQTADWVNKNSDYIYIGSSLKMGADPTIVVCYEKEGNHGHDGMNMLFADGHVEFNNLPEAHKLINDSMQKQQQQP